MSSYDPYPEKLPSIALLPHCQQQGIDSAYSQEMNYSSFMPDVGLYTNSTNHATTDPTIQLDLYSQQHLSPPLTPAISPPSNMVDPVHFKRKYSLDSGHCEFNTHPSLAHDQDLYRRSSCSAMPVIDECDQSHLDHHQSLNYYHQPQHNYTYLSNTEQPSSLANDISPTAMDHCAVDHGADRKSSINSDSSLAKLNNNLGKRTSPAQHCQQGPNAPHKHICKYSYCGWSFKRYEHLKRHMLVHTGERPHVCAFPGCGKSFSRSDNFHAHYRTHTKKQSASGFQTPSRRGSAKFNSASAIETNLIATSPSSISSSSSTSSQHDLNQGFGSSHPFGFDSKPFDLSYTEMYDQSSFADNVQDPQSYIRIGMAPHGGVASLLNHDQASSSLFTPSMMTPTYDLPGDYTGFHSTAETAAPTSSTTLMGTAAKTKTTVKKQKKSRATMSSSLQQQGHHSNHTADIGQQKSHVCPITQCQRRFKRLEHLKRHMRIHTLERPFACSYPKCHKHFSRSDNLSQHMKTHQHRPEKRRQSTTTASSTSPLSTTMDDHHQQQQLTSTMGDGVYPDMISSSLPSCWGLSSEYIGC
ncbi:hypothetical protein [Absidia glauca]|uniref:C2H2-type domain-containing protein n=1 Tax=Absidia glauca TaxID=4829 RepID=A0A163JBY8_ABSGL|nr:hypothetical protein [Absidia glauca]